MSGKSIVIVGGGLAGLSAGIFARRNGFETQVFEQHSMPGGVCAAWKRQGYLIDGCIHWLMGAVEGQPFHELYRQVGALDRVHLRRLDSFGRFAWTDERGAIGRQIEITSSPDRLIRDWRALAPKDGAVIDQLEKGIKAFRDFRSDLEIMEEGVDWPTRLKVLWAARKQFYYFRRYLLPVEEFARQIQDPFLRWQISYSFLPSMPLFFLFMILGELTSGRLAIVEEGSLAFAQAMAQRLQELGGKIHYGAEVEAILAEKDCAIGIRLKDGVAHRADWVISAADGHSTLFQLLGGRYVDESTRRRYRTWPIFPPIVIVSFGVDRLFPEEPSSNTFKLTTALNTGNCPQDQLFLKIFNQNPAFAPPGKTVVQAILNADYDTWEKLAQDRSAYEREKERIAREVLQRMESLYPGIGERIEMKDVASPMTYVRYTRNYRGAWEGWMMTPQAFSERIPSALPGLSRFCMAGQWISAGGGVPTVILSGRSAIRKICRREGRPFQTA